MHVDYDLAVPCTLTHTLTALAQFTGAELGRARLILNPGAAGLTFRAKRPGADGNDLSVVVHDVTPRALARTAVVLRDDVIHVYLRRSVGALLATADEVAAVVNADANLPVWCSAGGTGVCAAAAETALTLGLDPVVTRGHRFAHASALVAGGGLFTWDQETSLVVHQVEVAFTGLGGDTDVRIECVDLDAGGVPVAASAVAVYRATLTVLAPSTAWVPSYGFVLGPSQALRVIGTATGFVRATARRASRFTQ